MWGCLGYRYKGQDRKAIWLNFGTPTINAVNMIGRAMKQFGPVSASRLAEEMAAAFEKAAKEEASGKNPGSPF